MGGLVETNLKEERNYSIEALGGRGRAARTPLLNRPAAGSVLHQSMPRATGDARQFSGCLTYYIYVRPKAGDFVAMVELMTDMTSAVTTCYRVQFCIKFLFR